MTALIEQIDVNEVKVAATFFREGIITMKNAGKLGRRLSGLHPSLMDRFPYGCCDVASNMLAQYLQLEFLEKFSEPIYCGYQYPLVRYYTVINSDDSDDLMLVDNGGPINHLTGLCEAVRNERCLYDAIIEYVPRM